MKDGNDVSDDREYPCILRATDGKNVNISTHVSSLTSLWTSTNSKRNNKVLPGELEKFHSAYGALLKGSMPSLRKRDKKREKEKAERIAARKKLATEPIIVDGSKRGSGRRKRQRKVKAALKQEESRKKFEERQKKLKNIHSAV